MKKEQFQTKLLPFISETRIVIEQSDGMWNFEASYQMSRDGEGLVCLRPRELYMPVACMKKETVTL